jgi:small subunit ribosomal protein S6
MRRYETIVIFDPDLTEDDRTVLLDRIKEIISQQEGVFLQEDLWGVKKLAYDINKKPRGYYVRLDYCAMGPAVDELERFCRIDDRVMKYLTVQLASDVDVEQIKAQIAAAQASAATPASATETASPREEATPQDDSGDDQTETPETMPESQEE